MLDMLYNDSLKDDVPQSGVVSEKMLDTILDRSYLAAHRACPFAASGVGYKVIQGKIGNASLLMEEEPASRG